jgi:hypothetical protein
MKFQEKQRLQNAQELSEAVGSELNVFGYFFET